MDTSKAMAILGFPSSQGFENTEMVEVQHAFLHKLQKYETISKSGNPRSFSSKRDELRRMNEAYQYLIRKRRKLTGRAMTDNWQLIGGKSNKAMDIITSLKGMACTSNPNPLTGNVNKKEDVDIKRQIEFDSAAAKALADELVVSAGLELPIVEILNHASKTQTHEPTTGSKQDRKKLNKQHKSGHDYRSNLFVEERSREHSGLNNSGFPGSSNHSATYCSISLPSYSSAPPPISSSNEFHSGPKHSYSTTAHDFEKKISTKTHRHSSTYRFRGTQSVDRVKKPSSLEISRKSTSSYFLYKSDCHPLHVVASTSDLPSEACMPNHDLLEAKALEDEGIRMIRKALSSLNLVS
jgi:hypothetical protein